MKKRFGKVGILFLLLLPVLLFFPGKSAEGVSRGLVLCAQVLIPSLFPFTVCVLMLMRSGAFSLLDFLDRPSRLAFGINAEAFSVFLLSMIGGYPVGAGLLAESVKENRISQRNASYMLGYCVNAGPAFIVMAVGAGLLHSKTIGWLLLLSHVLASVIMALFCRRYTKKENAAQTSRAAPQVSFADLLVSSVGDAATSVFSICTFVILFSILRSYLLPLASRYRIVSFLLSLLEVTNAVSDQKNLYLIAFLIGFSGICVWCQIYATADNFPIRFLPFIGSRLAHGLLSAGILFLLIQIFRPALPSIGNGVFFLAKPVYRDTAVSASLVIMVFLFLLTVGSKKHSGNFAEDVV